MKRSTKGALHLVLWPWIALVGCTGGIDGPPLEEEIAPPPGGEGGAGGAGPPKSSPPGPVTPPAAPGTCATVGPAPLRRLTALEYRNTVRDLLGSTPAFDVAPDAEDGPFKLNVSADVAGEDVRVFMSAAEAVAAGAAGRVSQLVSCQPSAGKACADQFIREFGARAFRRPLTVDETVGLGAVFAAGGDFAGGIRLVVEALLQSPQFLYLVEGGAATPGTKVALGGYEIASRLSYFLWRSMPDQALFQAAAQNALATPEQIEAQALRMMKDPKFTGTLTEFYQELLGFHGGESVPDFESIEKDTKAFPGWNDALKASMKNEVMSLVTEAYKNGRSFEWLMAGGTSFVDPVLASFYGLGAPRGSGLQATTLPATSNRVGLLTTGGLLALYGHEAQSAPVQRGVLLRSRMMCMGEPPPPPSDVNAAPVGADPKLTGREQIEQRTSGSPCAGCHSLINPFGFLFENYDGAGRYRQADVGKPVNARAQLAASDIPGEIDGAVDLSRKLAQSEQARACLATQWMHFALGAVDATGADACSLAGVMKQFQAGNHALPSLLTAIAKSDSFRFRRAP